MSHYGSAPLLGTFSLVFFKGKKIKKEVQMLALAGSSVH